MDIEFHRGTLYMPRLLEPVVKHGLGAVEMLALGFSAKPVDFMKACTMAFQPTPRLCCIVKPVLRVKSGDRHYWASLGTSGVFGSNSVTFSAGTGDGVQCNLGSLMQSAAKIIPLSYLPADGRLLMISQNSALWDLLGNTYVDGVTTFALPDLRTAAPNNTIYLICVAGVFP